MIVAKKQRTGTHMIGQIRQVFPFDPASIWIGKIVHPGATVVNGERVTRVRSRGSSRKE